MDFISAHLTRAMNNVTDVFITSPHLVAMLCLKLVCIFGKNIWYNIYHQIVSFTQCHILNFQHGSTQNILMSILKWRTASPEMPETTHLPFPCSQNHYHIPSLTEFFCYTCFIYTDPRGLFPFMGDLFITLRCHQGVRIFFQCVLFCFQGKKT